MACTMTINGKQVASEKGKTILEAANNEIYIPSLCYHCKTGRQPANAGPAWWKWKGCADCKPLVRPKQRMGWLSTPILRMPWRLRNGD